MYRPRQDVLCHCYCVLKATRLGVHSQKRGHEVIELSAGKPTERFEASFRKVGVTAWDGSLTNRERGF